MLISFYSGEWDYWALYHKVTFDGPNKLIYINDGESIIDVEVDLYSDWKEWFAIRNHSAFDPAMRSIGGDPTVGGDFAGATFFMTNGWRIYVDAAVRFEGNLFSDNYDSPFLTADNAVIVSQKFTNLIDKVTPDTTALGSAIAPAVAPAVWGAIASAPVANSYGEIAQQLAYQNEVHLDSILGAVGTAFPIGTKKYPVSNIANAMSIAAANNIGIIHVEENVTVLASDDVSSTIVMGSHATKSEIIVTSGATTEFTQFRDCTLKGTMGGQVVVRDSMMEDVFSFEGIIHQTLLAAGTLQIGGTRPTYILDSFGVSNGTAVEIGFATDVKLEIKNYTGNIKLIDKSGTEPVVIDMNSGNVELDSTVTAGTITVRGNCTLTDNSAGATVIDETLDATRLTDVWKLNGLDANDPLVATPNKRYVQSSSIAQDITGDPATQVTVTRE